MRDEGLMLVGLLHPAFVRLFTQVPPSLTLPSVHSIHGVYLFSYAAPSLIGIRHDQLSSALVNYHSSLFFAPTELKPHPRFVFRSLVDGWMIIRHASYLLWVPPLPSHGL